MKRCVLLSAIIIGLAVFAVDVNCETAHPQLDGPAWPNGFKMKFQLKLLQAVSGGWKITLRFSNPVPSIQIWRARIVSISADKKVYKLKNMSWNKQLSKCATLEMSFNGVKSAGQAAPTAEVTFMRKSGGNDNLDPSACATTTVRPTTTQTPATTNTPTVITTNPPPTTTQLPPTTITNLPTTLPMTHPTAIPTSGLTSGETTQPQVAHVGDDWPTGFKMLMRIRLLAAVSGGWKIKLVFTEPALNLQIWKAGIEAVSSDSKTYWLENLSWNGHLAKCALLEMYFMADKVSGTPKATATLYRVGQGAVTLDPNACSTNPPTTAAPKPTTVAPKTTPPKPQPTTAEPAPTTHEPPPTTTGPEPTTAEPASTTQEPDTTTAEPKTTAAPKPSTAEPATTNPVVTTTANPSTKQPTTTKAPVTSKPSKYDYDLVLKDSILFYEAQRSGKLPSNNRVSWRKDSALNDRGKNGEDLIGGWYDAGDYVKFGFPMASSATLLAWGLVQYRGAYQAAGQLDNALDSIKWATDYFMKAHTKKYEFYGQVGDGHVDHAFWGRPEDMTMARPAFKITTTQPGSDLAAETAAALAAASIAFNPTDPDYSTKLRKHAEELYEFADNYRGKYSDSITNAQSFYASHSGYNDELVWGAAWLYRATNNPSYLSKAENYYNAYNLNKKAWAFSWDDKTAGAQVLLAQITGKSTYKQAAQSFLNDWLPSGSVSHTPKGLAWRDKWGSNRYSANAAFLALVAADTGINPAAYREFATKQINYMLGDGGRSFVVGFGQNPPKRPHHSSSACPLAPSPCGWNEYNSDTDNAHVLTGALVGGPDKNDNYKDDRKDYVKNEVTTDYNAGFQSAVAGLKHLLL